MLSKGKKCACGALNGNRLLHDKDMPEAVIAALFEFTGAFGVTIATCAAVVTQEMSRAAAHTKACEYAPPLEKPPAKPLSTLEQGGGEGKIQLGGYMGRQILAGLVQQTRTLQMRVPQLGLQFMRVPHLGLQMGLHDESLCESLSE